MGGLTGCSCSPYATQLDLNLSLTCHQGGTSYEAKLAFSPTDTDQLVGHAVVALFIHSNKHLDQNALVPALGISGILAEVMAILYDCREDVMLHISPLPWLDFSSKRFVEDGILVL
jgi:hypothetical protein